MEATVFTRSMTIAEFKTANSIDSLKAIPLSSGTRFFRMYKDGEVVVDPADPSKELGGRCSTRAYELIEAGEFDKIEVCWYAPEGGEPSWMLKSKDSAKGIMF